jgi:type IV pilus assembly protein PilM
MGAFATVVQRFQPERNAQRVGLIGLECALNAIHLVQLAVDDDGNIHPHASTSLPAPRPREELLADVSGFRSLIREALSRDRFRGRAIVTTLPADGLRIIPLTYSASSDRPDAAAILEAMGDRLEGPLADYVIDYLPVRPEQGAGERMAIVASARRDFVIRHLELLRKCGLETRHLEIGPAAIRRLVSAVNAPGQYRNVLAINCGRTSSYLTVISGARLLFDQEVRFGEARLLELLANRLDMQEEQVREVVRSNGLDRHVAATPGTAELSNAETAATLQEIVKPEFLRLAEEISRILVYAASQSRGEAVSRIYLFGSLARWRGADTLLGQLVKLDVQTIPNPLQVFHQAGKEATGGPPAEPEIAVATGLALHGLLEHG